MSTSAQVSNVSSKIPSQTQINSESDKSLIKKSKPFPVLDLDEGGQGAYMLVETGRDIAKDGVGSVYGRFTLDAYLLKTDPKELLVSVVTLDSVQELQVSASVGAGMLILSGLGIYGGAKGEIKAKKLAGVLNAMQAAQMKKPLLIQEQETALLETASKMNKHNQYISEAMFRSGCAMFGKTLLDIGAQTVLLAIGSCALLAGSIASASLTFALATGFLSLCLGVWTAASAIRLGMAFYSKTQDWSNEAGKNRQVIQDRLKAAKLISGQNLEGADLARLVENEDLVLENLGPSSPNAMGKRPQAGSADIEELAQDLEPMYRSFLELAKKHEDFANSYKRWNLGFLSSTSLYGGCAIFQTTCVTLPALAGITTFAIPSVLCGLFVGSMFGSIFMVVCSQQFLHMIDKQAARDKELYRFMSRLPLGEGEQQHVTSERLPLLASLLPAGTKIDTVDRDVLIAAYNYLGQKEGEQLQNAVHARLVAREQALHTLFAQVAVKINKNYNPKFLNWKPATETEGASPPAFLNSCKAAGSAVGVLMKSFAHHPTKLVDALQNARTEWALKRNILTEERLSAFFESEEDSRSVQANFMLSFWKAEQAYLTAKLNVYKALCKSEGWKSESTEFEGYKAFFDNQHAQSKNLNNHINTAIIPELTLLSSMKDSLESRHVAGVARRMSLQRANFINMQKNKEQNFAEACWKQLKGCAKEHGVLLTVATALARYEAKAKVQTEAEVQAEAKTSATPADSSPSLAGAA